MAPHHTATVFLCLILVSSCLAQSKTCGDSDARCPRWARNGECVRNRSFMHWFCAKSCDQCRVRDADCADHDMMCSGWAQRGECRINKPYMRITCPRACAFCYPAQDHDVPHVSMAAINRLWKRYEEKNVIS